MHYKINNESFKIPLGVKKIYFNERPLKNQLHNIIYKKFKLNDLIINNLNKIKFTNEDLIKPIYVSENKILNW